MTNTQPIERPRVDLDGRLDIHSVFYTIQGEGPFVGRPAVFVRAAGCSLACPLCDTLYTGPSRKIYSPDELVEEVTRVSRVRDPLVVLTGGEPLRQNIWPFLDRLFCRSQKVQVETNGVSWCGIPLGVPLKVAEEWTTFVCSPKTTRVHPYLKPYVNALKYVVDADHQAADGLPTRTLGQRCGVARPWPGFRGDVYLQPADERDPVKNTRNVKAAVDACMEFGYRLCLQTHKIVGLD